MQRMSKYNSASMQYDPLGQPRWLPEIRFMTLQCGVDDMPLNTRIQSRLQLIKALKSSDLQYDNHSTYPISSTARPTSFSQLVMRSRLKKQP